VVDCFVVRVCIRVLVGNAFLAHVTLLVFLAIGVLGSQLEFSFVFDGVGGIFLVVFHGDVDVVQALDVGVDTV
jgi:hypothetical protein